MEQMTKAMNTILSTPATGDNSQTIIIVGAVVCVALIAVIVLMGKRRK